MRADNMLPPTRALANLFQPFDRCRPASEVAQLNNYCCPIHVTVTEQERRPAAPAATRLADENAGGLRKGL